MSIATTSTVVKPTIPVELVLWFVEGTAVDDDTGLGLEPGTETAQRERKGQKTNTKRNEGCQHREAHTMGLHKWGEATQRNTQREVYAEHTVEHTERDKQRNT